MVGEGAALLVKRALTGANLDPEVTTALPRFLDIYDRRLLAHTELYPGTREMLDAIAAETRLSVLTNKPQHHTERILEGLSIRRYFDAVVGGDTPLGRKPDPGGLWHLMTQARVPPQETILIGDSAIDLRTAHAAGVTICLVRFGFGFPGAEKELTGDEWLADSPAAAADLIRRRRP